MQNKSYKSYKICRKIRIGLKGFSELKLRLSYISKSIIIDGNFVNLSNSLDENTELFFQKYISIHNQSFHNQFNYLKAKNIDKFME